jgi:hypothetical protein
MQLRSKLVEFTQMDCRKTFDEPMALSSQPNFHTTSVGLGRRPLEHPEGDKSIDEPNRTVVAKLQAVS